MSEEKKSKKKRRGGVRKEIEKGKKTTKRSSLKHKALHPEVNLKSRYNEINDLASYKDQLNEEELDWLDRFSHEYICGNFNHQGEILHNTDELRKDCYNNNNRRNRDITSQEEAKGSMKSVDEMTEHWHSREILNEALKTSIFTRIRKKERGKHAKKSTSNSD